MRAAAATATTAGLAALIQACASAPEPTAEAALAIGVSGVPPSRCRLTVDGQDFLIPGEEARLVRTLGALRHRWSRSVAVGGPDTPVRCVAAAHEHATRAGFGMDEFREVQAPRGR